MVDDICYRGIRIWLNKGKYEVVGRYKNRITKVDNIDTMKANIDLFWTNRYGKWIGKNTLVNYLI